VNIVHFWSCWGEVTFAGVKYPTRGDLRLEPKKWDAVN